MLHSGWGSKSLPRPSHTVAACWPASAGSVTYSLHSNRVWLNQDTAYTFTTRVITYTYDPLNRLTNADYSTGESFAYGYNAVGNRTVMTDATGVTTYTYDAANRLTSVGGVSYTWDARGNLVSDGTLTYTYNAASRMVQAESVTVTLVFTYNAQGLRVSQNVDGDVITFTWDWASGIPEMLSDGEDLYLVGHETLGQWDGSEWVFYLPDALGSIRQETDGTGDVTDSWEWTPFGVEVGTVQEGLGYTGEWQSGYAQIQYTRARWYQPRVGRWTSPDPIIPSFQNPQNINRYVYVRNNVVNLVDPSGLCPDGDPECEALGELAPIITENARKFNQRIFTNMTNSGFAAMLGAKILYEGELPGGSQTSPMLEELPEILDQCNLFDFFYRLWKQNRDPLFRGASFGITNVYFDQAAQSAWWWQDLVAHRDVYGLDLQQGWLETRYYEVWELEALWYRQPPFPGTQPVPSPWDSRQTLISELRTVKGAIQFQALEMLHQGWKIYEGPAGSWGGRGGTPTAEISAFRIAMGVLANAPEPDYWVKGAEGYGNSERWVGLIPRAADCMGLSAVPSVDYLTLSARERQRLGELEYLPTLP